MMEEWGLSPETTDCVRGIFAVFIMLGHLGAETKVWYLYPLWKASLMFVGIFFMLSGYGLMLALVFIIGSVIFGMLVHCVPYLEFYMHKGKKIGIYF